MARLCGADGVLNDDPEVCTCAETGEGHVFGDLHTNKGK